jgi:hypothetical protein
MAIRRPSSSEIINSTSVTPACLLIVLSIVSRAPS